MPREPEALLALTDRLAERFPEQQRSVIEQVVAEEHARFDDGPIRDYVPVLVERAAKMRLSRLRPLSARDAGDSMLAGRGPRLTTS